jgi:RNA ligase (TIGR02306 family)
MGWLVVLRKDEFKAGDLCVFFEADSILPEEPWAEFMRTRKYRVKVTRLKGVLSQGLALPTDILGDDIPAVGTDVTERLGVTRHEEPVTLICADNGQYRARAFPSDVPKTDELRLQSCLSMLDDMRGLPYYVTTKLDGQSVTFYRDKCGEFYACTRNLRIMYEEAPLWRMVERYRLKEVLPAGTAIQGELVGPKIQRNRMCLEERDLFVFNVYDVECGYLGYDRFIRFCRDACLQTVPVDLVARDVPGDHMLSLEHLISSAKGLYRGTNNHREGIVVRPLHERRASGGGRLSFKVINDDYLLNGGT